MEESEGAIDSEIKMEQGMIMKIGRIIYCLEASNIQNFLFVLDLNLVPNHDQLDADKILNDLNSISANSEVKSDGLCFVITNKGCTLNGWKESWSMNIFS